MEVVTKLGLNELLEANASPKIITGEEERLELAKNCDLPLQAQLRFVERFAISTVVDGEEINDFLSERCKLPVAWRNWWRVKDYGRYLPFPVIQLINESKAYQVNRDQLWIVDPTLDRPACEPFLVMQSATRIRSRGWDDTKECYDFYVLAQWNNIPSLTTV